MTKELIHDHGKQIEVVLSERNKEILYQIVDLQNLATLYMLLVFRNGMRRNHLEIPCEVCWRNCIMEFRDIANLMEELIGDKIAKPKMS